MSNGFDEHGSPLHDVLIVRLARGAAALYRAVPVEGAGLVAQAEELAHASELERFADGMEERLEDDTPHTIRPGDIRTVCRLLIDVRRNPSSRSAAEVAVAREHFPEVEDETLDRLERLVGYYTSLLSSD